MHLYKLYISANKLRNHGFLRTILIDRWPELRGP